MSNKRVRVTVEVDPESTSSVTSYGWVDVSECTQVWATAHSELWRKRQRAEVAEAGAADPTAQPAEQPPRRDYVWQKWDWERRRWE